MRNLNGFLFYLTINILNLIKCYKVATIKELYEGIDLSEYSIKEIQDSKKLYNYIVESAEIAKEENKELGDVLDEGILGMLAGGVIGATAGASIMKAICNALGLKENGVLYNTLTSRLVMGAVGASLGERW